MEPGTVLALGAGARPQRGGRITWSLDAGGPMSFVTEDQVNSRRTFIGCLFDDAERLVGAEDDRHYVRACRAEGCRDRGGVRGHQDLKFMQRRAPRLSAGGERSVGHPLRSGAVACETGHDTAAVLSGAGRTAQAWRDRANPRPAASQRDQPPAANDSAGRGRRAAHGRASIHSTFQFT